MNARQLTFALVSENRMILKISKEDINLAIDGRLTQGENIANNRGLKQAYKVSCKGMTL